MKESPASPEKDPLRRCCTLLLLSTCLFAGALPVYSANVSIDSFYSLSDPIPSLWTYYYANISSTVNRTVVLSLDIYPAVNASHPAGHHGYFNKQISLVSGEEKTVQVRYNWQGKAQYDIGSGWVDADTWYNSGCCGYVNYSVGFVVWDGSSVLSQETLAQELNPLDKKVLTFYFYWYDGMSGGHVWCSDPAKDALTDDPIYGKGSWFSWQNPAFHAVELARMKRSGIDIALPIYWGDCSNTCNFGGDCPATKKWADGGLEKVVEALDNMSSGGVDHPSIGMFYDTSANAVQYCACEQGLSDWTGCSADLSVSHNKDVFYQMIEDFYSKVPDKYVAKIGGRYIVWLYTSAFFSNIDCSTFDLARERFREEYGKELLIVSQSNFCGEGSDAYGAYISLTDISKASTEKLDIPLALAGYDHTATTTAYGCGGTRDPLIVDRRNGSLYVENWDKCIADNEGWILIGGGWNEFHEGSDIAPTEQYGLKYLELTNQKAGEFKGSVPAWHECVSDDECIRNCTRYQCVSNSCSSTVLDENVCPNAYDYELLGFDSWDELFPRQMKAGTELIVPLKINNTGTFTWNSSGEAPPLASYHWKQGENYSQYEGIRNAIPWETRTGESALSLLRMNAPSSTGSYTLIFDIVRDGVLWFSSAHNGAVFEKEVSVVNSTQYSFSYSGSIPGSMVPSADYYVASALKNTGSLTWPSVQNDSSNYVALSYHWLAKNSSNQRDGIRTHLPYDMALDQTANLSMQIRSPAYTGRYLLVIEPVHEGVTWFSGAGAQTYYYDVSVETTTTSSTSTTFTSTTTTTSSSTPSTIEQCVMPGNNPPCGAVELSEVVSAINLWADGIFELGGVVDLINSWADPERNPPN